jgi:hypothetical protein
MDDVESIVDILDPGSAGKPDLVLTGIVPSPDNPEVGEMVSVEVEVANQGRRRSKAVPIALMVWDNIVATAEIPPLSRGEAKSITFSDELALPVGISVLKAVVDPGSDPELGQPKGVLGTTVVVGEPSVLRSYSWDYGTNSFSVDLRIPSADFTALPQNRPVGSYEEYLEYIEPDDRMVRALAEILEFYSKAGAFTDNDRVSFALRFVQEMPYTSDHETRGDNFPRFPVETIAEGGGDCEDTCALFASIVGNDETFNYGTSLIIVNEDHMAVGVTGSEGVGGVYFELLGKRYYYCETTGKGYAIGELPDVYEGADFRLIEIA